MGAGIAQACAAAGFQVAMRDIEQRLVDGGFRRIREPLAKRVEKGKMATSEVEAIVSKIRGVVNLKDAVTGAQVVIEAVFEKMDIKRELYAELDRLCPPEVVFASNTSSLSITEMANATKRADRVVGMHFFNPAPVMKLVEVIRGSETSDATVALIKELCTKLGKDAVEVRESPGFVVNRLLVPMMNEAFNLLQEGVASAEDIDKAMKLVTNMPMGPFELADYTGLDIGLDGSARRLLGRSPSGRWRPNARPASSDGHGSDDRRDDEDEEDEPDPHLEAEEDRRQEAACLIPIARQVVAAGGLARAVVGLG